MSKKTIRVSDALFREIAHAHGFVVEGEPGYIDTDVQKAIEPVVCLCCGNDTTIAQATDVGTEYPEWVSNACLSAYFAWQELQSVPAYVERYERSK